MGTMQHTIKISRDQRIKVSPDHAAHCVVIDLGPNTERLNLTLDQIGALLFALEESGEQVERATVH